MCIRDRLQSIRLGSEQTVFGLILEEDDNDDKPIKCMKWMNCHGFLSPLKIKKSVHTILTL